MSRLALESSEGQSSATRFELLRISICVCGFIVVCDYCPWNGKTSILFDSRLMKSPPRCW